MADYAIGDVQGCYDPLLRLLDAIDFDDKRDRLWFVGDLVNRGPDSLAVLHFIRALPLRPYITLGNHDLHLLNLIFVQNAFQAPDDATLAQVLQAPDAEALGHWLRAQPLLIYDADLQIVMTHAGIAPMWDLASAQHYAAEVERALQGPEFRIYLTQMYGNEPALWSDALQGFERLRVITNYFTRMRFCNAVGALDFSYKGNVAQAKEGLYPWYAVPIRKKLNVRLVFGHWAALQGLCPLPDLHAIDTGCVWGRQLTALRLQDGQRFSVWNRGNA